MKSFIKPDIICIIITPLFDIGYYTLKAILYSKWYARTCTSTLLI